jgi:indole-3-glycerol phosphate synthase
MNILDTIIQYKKIEVSQNKLRVPLSELKRSAFYSRDVLSLQSFLTQPDKTGIIAEFKRKSPSKGIIHPNPDLYSITKNYVDHGASALSILTDTHFFGGSSQDLMDARMHKVPLLRKEFIVDAYQIDEAKAIGADAILLIAACLTKEEVKLLSSYAQGLGLEVLLELHAEEELAHICDNIKLVGINNRNLKTFEVDIEQSLRMASKLEGSYCLIAESGIHNADQVNLFKSNGFKGFLIGEQFMKHEDPGKAFAAFVSQL